MNAGETHEFAERPMKEIWEPYDYSAVERFYNKDVRGHNRSQDLDFDDVVYRLRTDPGRYADSVYDITDIIAENDKFAFRFIYTATDPTTGQPVDEQVNYNAAM